MTVGNILNIVANSSTEVTSLAADAVGINYLPQGDFGNNPNSAQQAQTLSAINTGNYLTDGVGILQTSAARYTISLSTDVPTIAQAGRDLGKSLYLDLTTADSSIAATDHSSIRLPTGLAGQQDLITGPMYLSFWIKTTITGTYCVSLRIDGAGISGYTWSYIQQYTVSVANTWEYKTLAFPIATGYNGTSANEYIPIANSPGAGIVVAFALMCGANAQGTAGSWITGCSTTSSLATSSQVNALSSTANNIRFADVRLRPGTTDNATAAVDSNTVFDLVCRWNMWREFWVAATQTNTTTMLSNEIPFIRPNIAPLSDLASSDVTLYSNDYTAASLDWIGVTGTSTKRASTISQITPYGFNVTQAAALDYNVSGFYIYKYPALPNVIA